MPELPTFPGVEAEKELDTAEQRVIEFVEKIKTTHFSVGGFLSRSYVEGLVGTKLTDEQFEKIAIVTTTIIQSSNASIIAPTILYAAAYITQPRG